MTRHIPIASIANCVCRPSDLVKALAMLEATEELKAFFDDSGTHGESLVTAISGFMAPVRVWTKIEGNWKSALEDYQARFGVTWYHASDVYNWEGEWRGAPLDVCRDAPMRFATILSTQNIMPVWAAVVNEDFHRYATPEFLSLFPTPFDLCFHEAMGQLYHWCKETPDAPNVTPVIAHGDYTERITKAHERYRNDGDFSAYIGSLVIDSPRCVVPLQTADLLAYEFYHWWKDTEYPPRPLKYVDRPVLHKAVERNEKAMRGACYAGDGMRLAVERHVERLRKRRQGGSDEGEG